MVALMKKGVPVNPVAMDDRGKWINLLDSPHSDPLDFKTSSPDLGTIYARQDDVSAVALFYLDSPENLLPVLAPVAERLLRFCREPTTRRNSGEPSLRLKLRYLNVAQQRSRALPRNRDDKSSSHHLRELRDPPVEIHIQVV